MISKMAPRSHVKREMRTARRTRAVVRRMWIVWGERVGDLVVEVEWRMAGKK